MGLQRYAIAVSLLALIFVLWLTGGQARGQSTGTGTGTPTTGTPVVVPTVIATPTIPSGQDLLTRMAAAMAAKNTYHETTHSTVEIPSITRGGVTAQSDVSIKPRLWHIIATTRATMLNVQPARTTTRRQEVVVVKQKLAVKVGKRAWSCSSVPSGAQVGAQVLVPASGTARIKSIDNLGAETVNTVPVWHVREVVTVSAAGTSTPLITGDYFISQADYMLVRLTSSGSMTVSGVTGKVTNVQDYTNYGEAVNVTLPAACKGKSETAGLTSGILGGFNLPN